MKMAYRITDDAALVMVRGRDGEVRYHSHGGPEIPWMAPQQAERYMQLGIVEEVG